MSKFKQWMKIREGTVGDINAGFDAMSGGLSFMKYSRSAALYLANRMEESEKLLAHLPPYTKSQILAFFAKSFPNPNPKLQTSQIFDDASFKNWLNDKFIPFMNNLTQPQTQPQNFSISAYVRSLNVKDEFFEVTTTQNKEYIIVRNKNRSSANYGKVVDINLKNMDLEKAKKDIKKLFES
jgi:uncharacterized protein YqcC (DUF446 family)